MNGYHIYILASKRNGSLYVGVTSDIAKRIYEHKNDLAGGHTKKHGIKMLVHIETFPAPQEAIHREKCIKRWKHDWKIELIEKHNPGWRDLYEDIMK